MRTFIFKLLIIFNILTNNIIFAQNIYDNDLCFSVKINDQDVDIKAEKNTEIVAALEIYKDLNNERVCK